MSRKKSAKKILLTSEHKLKELCRIEDLSPYENILLDDLPFKYRVKHQLRENNCMTLAQLLNYSAQEISNLRHIGETSIINIFDTLKEYFKVTEFYIPKKIEPQEEIHEPETLQELTDFIIKTVLKNKIYFEVLRGRANGRILKSIGDEMGYTRERIRQIEFSAVKNFSKTCHFEFEKLLTLIKAEIGERKFITIDDLTNATDENTGKIFLYLFSKSNWQGNFSYEEFTNTIIINQEIAEKIDYESIIAQFPEYILESELQKKLEKISNGEKFIAEALRARVALKYQHTGKLWHKNWLSLNYPCAYILKKYFKDGYKIDNLAEYKKFMQLLQKDFGEVFSFTQRALDTKISAYIGVLCARGKYIHPDFVNIPQEILELIKNFIDSSERQVFMYKELYELLKENFVGTPINNHYFLQGVLKYYKFPYILKKDQLSKNGNLDLISEINLFVKERGKVSLEEIQKHFVGLEYSNIMIAVKKSSEVIFMGGRKYLHVNELNFSEKDFSYIEQNLSQLCQNSPVTSRYFFGFLREHLPEFLKNNRIEHYEEILGILKYMFGEKFKYARPYIFLDDATKIHQKQVFLKYFKDTDKLSVAQLLKFCGENKIRNVSKNYLIENLKPEFILIDKETLSRPEKIGVTAEVISEVNEIIKSAVEENGGWLSARKFTNFGLLPPLDVEWNSFLLENVIMLAKNLKIIRTPASVSGFSSAIFINENFADYDFEDFLVKILIDRHNLRPFKNYEEILNWLQAQGICNLTLPKFLFLEEHLTFDTTGKIILR